MIPRCNRDIAFFLSLRNSNFEAKRLDCLLHHNFEIIRDRGWCFAG